jgi:hypothetical protein
MERLMRTLNVSFPEVAFVAATRGMAGAGIGLLAASHLKEGSRHKLGFLLLAIGILTTIPIAFAAGRRIRREPAANEDHSLPRSVPPREFDVRGLL